MSLAALDLPGRRRVDIVLDSEAEVRLPGLSRDDLSPDELAALERLTRITRSDEKGLVLRRNRRHRVGRVVVRGNVVTVPPPFASELFITFFLYASGADLSRFMLRRPAAIDLARVPEADRFLALLALLHVRVAEQILQIHLSRAYVAREERIKTIRGRPLWARNFGRHPASGITARYHLLETDDLLNRLILAGLVRSEELLRDTPWAAAAHTQGFIWRSIASVTRPSLDLFDRAERRVSRLTHHYRPGLQLARVLLFGGAPNDPFAGKTSLLQSLEFNLPSLYERFLARLLSTAWASRGIEVSAQERDRQAIVDGYDDVYRAVQPDLIVYRNGLPIAVIDAKFKPRYGRGTGAEPVASADRVDSADLYQVFFYEARLRRAFDLRTPIPAVILAPQLGESTAADVARRTISWKAGVAHDDAPYELRVIRLPLENLLRQLDQGKAAGVIVDDIPELSELVSAS